MLRTTRVEVYKNKNPCFYIIKRRAHSLAGLNPLLLCSKKPKLRTVGSQRESDKARE